MGNEEILADAVGGDAVFFDEGRAHVARMGIHNLHRAVFASDPKYDEWLNSARERLVRYPADNELFELASRGMIPNGSGRPRCSTPLPVVRELL